MKSELIISFKDFLMGLPQGLRFRVLIEGKILSAGSVSATNAVLKFFFKPFDTKTINIYDINNNGIASVPTQASYQLEIQLIKPDGSFDKSIGKGKLKSGTRLTLVAVSPWVKVPLSGGGDLTNSFLEVEYNIKNQNDKVEVVNVKIFDIPKRILTTALKYRGSKAWAGTVSKESAAHSTNGRITFGKDTNKCNLFVNDVLTEVGISVAWIEHGASTKIPYYQRLSPPTAGEWATPTKLTNSWSTNYSPLPGDIGAYKADYTDASGHVGFVLADGVCVSAGWSKIEVNDAGFRNKRRTANSGDHDFTVFRRYKHAVIK